MSSVKNSYPSVTQQFIDFTVQTDAEQKFASLALGSNRPDAVFFTFMTPQAPSAYRLTRALRDRWGKQVLIIHGGCHATPLPIESIHSGADAVAQKEGELTTTEIVSSLKTGMSFCRDRLQEIAG